MHYEIFINFMLFLFEDAAIFRRSRYRVFRTVKTLIQRSPQFVYNRSPKPFVVTGNFNKIWPAGEQRSISYTAWRKNKDAYNYVCNLICASCAI